MQGSKDPDKASLALEATAMRSSSWNSRAAVLAAVPGIWGHLYQELQCMSGALIVAPGPNSLGQSAVQLWHCSGPQSLPAWISSAPGVFMSSPLAFLFSLK